MAEGSTPGMQIEPNRPDLADGVIGWRAVDRSALRPLEHETAIGPVRGLALGHELVERHSVGQGVEQAPRGQWWTSQWRRR
jgi:hypothetical protein